MANVVEVVIKATDQTNPAMQRAIANSQSLGKEIKGLGSVMSVTGNIAGTLGNQAFASLANQATMLAFAGKEVIQVFSKMNVVKASIVGLALAGGAAIVGQIMKERDEQKKAEEDLISYGKAFDSVLQAQQKLMNSELWEFQENKRRHIERIRDVQELAIDQDSKNRFIKESYLLMEREKTKIAAEQSAARQRILDQERKKALTNASLQLSAWAQLLGNLSQLTATFGKKSFGLTQALRYAEAVVNTASAVTNALASPAPWPTPLIFAAAAAAAGATQIAIIAGTKKPQAHSGLDYVPQEATYKLQRGEMVLDPGTSEEVRQAARGGAGGGWSQPLIVQVGDQPLAKILLKMSRDGRLTISERAIV